jgi:predicted Zn-dependent protease
MTTSIRHALIGITLLIVMWQSGCTPVAYTGRSQLLLISDTQAAQLSRQSRAQFLQQADSQGLLMRPTDSEQSAKIIPSVNQVAMRIVEAAGMANRAQWRVFVVKSNQVNANVTPDGTIVVYTGILPLAQNPTGLAAVLGHEVSHVVARHTAERLSQTLLAQGVNQTAVALSDPKHRPAVAAALGVGTQYGVLLPFSRAHESEADHLGLYFMAKAGFDPAEAPAFWRRMEARGGNQPPEFLSTHPSHSTRVRQLEGWLPDARRYFEDRTLPLPTRFDSAR